MNLFADLAVQSAKHAVSQIRQPLLMRGTVTSVDAAAGNASHGTATVLVAGFDTAVTVDNLAGASKNGDVWVSFPAVGVAYVAYII